MYPLRSPREQGPLHVVDVKVLGPRQHVFLKVSKLLLVTMDGNRNTITRDVSASHITLLYLNVSLVLASEVSFPLQGSLVMFHFRLACCSGYVQCKGAFTLQRRDASDNMFSIHFQWSQANRLRGLWVATQS